MRWRLALSCLLIVQSLCAWAVKPDKNCKLVTEENSPALDIVIEHYTDLTAGGARKQVWLANSKNREDRVLLFEHSRHVEVVFNKDESYLVINNFSGSSETIIQIFRRVQGLHYEEIKKPDPNVLLWRYFMRLNAPEAVMDKEREITCGGVPFDHRYIECLQWLDRYDVFLVELSGHLNHNNHAVSWVCLFDVETMKPTLDLNILNKAEIVLAGKWRSGTRGIDAQTTNGQPQTSATRHQIPGVPLLRKNTLAPGK